MRNALYISYLDSVNKEEKYDVDRDILIVQFFRNIEFIRKMLFKKERTLNINLNLDETLEVLIVLNKLYTEEEIFNLYYKSNDPNIREIIQLTRYLLETYSEDVLFENFNKVECRFESLFKELLRIFYKLRNDGKH